MQGVSLGFLRILHRRGGGPWANGWEGGCQGPEHLPRPGEPAGEPISDPDCSTDGLHDLGGITLLLSLFSYP